MRFNSYQATNFTHMRLAWLLGDQRLHPTEEKRFGQLSFFVAAGVLAGLAALAAIYFLAFRVPPPVATAMAVSVTQPETPHIDYLNCWFTVPTGRAVRCGRVVAAEIPGLANGRFVSLPFVVFQSGKGRDEAPLVFLHGGPGEPAGIDAEGVTRWWTLIDQSEWMRRQDLIVFDQRGAGLAEPSLKCPEMQSAGYEVFIGKMSNDAAAGRWAEAAKACRDRLTEAGIPLGSYNTETSTEDLAVLLKGLGYKSWNLYGVSYGTRLALAFLRTHPAGIRSVILDSVYPPNVHAYVEAPANAAHAFTALFEDCAKRPSCLTANPHLAAAFRDLATRTAMSPLQAPSDVAGDSPQAGPGLVPLDSAKLIEVLFGGFYSWQDIRQLPEIINAAAGGDTRPLAPLVEEALDTYRSREFSYGLFLSTECHDDWSYDSPAAIENAASSADVFGAFARANLPVVACPVWAVGSVTPQFHDPVRSDAPVLILTGDYDPITPPAWAMAAATTLPRSTVIHFPGIGHGIIASHRCADELAAQFLIDPTKSPYHDCLIGVSAGPWNSSRAAIREKLRRADHQ